jgi:Ca-activated chloride channel homolog
MEIKQIKLLSLILLFVVSGTASAQSERSLLNDGVDLYSQKKFSDSEVKFKKGLERDPKLFEGHFNLGDAYYKQGRYDEAIQAYKNSLQFTDNKSEQSQVYHNIGNSLLKTQKLQDCVGAYKNALKLNPKDNDTKYNLSYALNLMKENKNKNDKNKDKNKDKDQDKKKDQNQNQQKDQDKNKEKQQQQQQKDQISKEEAQRILDALKNNESDLQKKLRRAQGKPVTTEKDW